MPAKKRPTKTGPSPVQPAVAAPRAFPFARVVGMLVLLLVVAGLGWHFLGSGKPSVPGQPNQGAQPPAARYVGAQVCAGCHEAAARDWQGSDHAHAMLEARGEAVRGDFSGASLRHRGQEAKFFTRDGKPFVRTEGADGKPGDFEIRYTFGWYPLQQYLVDTGRGRLQALPFAWDSRDKAQGGQRWFTLYPEQTPKPGDSLHWTGRDQNWNFMCAGCHSTNLEKRYDLKSDSFDTRWSDIAVACEACHGAGSAHVDWAKAGGKHGGGDGHKGLTVAKAPAGQWAFATPGQGIAHWTGGERREAMAPCFACHSRRREIANPLSGDVPLLDQTVPSLLEPGLYSADGQIDGEVFEYGSFLQSRMYRAGVICQDCHQPHSGKPRLTGNSLCAQCHAPASFDTAAHHHHSAGGQGSQCVDCHMAGKTYMGVDFRRDHSFRLPRPDLSEKLGTPNACTGCHKDKPASWAAAQVRDWVGEPGRGHAPVAEALMAARQHRADGGAALLALLDHRDASPMARATALAALAEYPGPLAQEKLRAAVNDPEPLVRLAALRAFRLLPEAERDRLLLGRLNDEARAVRIEAARLAAAIPDSRLDGTDRARRDAALEALAASEAIHLDRPEAHLNLALLHLARGRAAEAEAALKQALAMDAGFAPARINLADLYRATGRDKEVEPLLREGLRLAPNSADLNHALGLLKVRQGERSAALGLLAAAAKAAPDNARYAYVYAVALTDGGKQAEALVVVEKALSRTPNDPALAQLLGQWRGGARQ
ncbi:hypothetical protein B9N43_02895 [Denitratisoma sp. DHT3]|uniref:tetratricopeptide repeat protein n=1 Tax=Denitratisoma sp. DHT3 TaxID=1981880 RepID=UPI0011988633|nr:tetratricopeptide repeat protein [Denitratisoma sp. DHT3]QDX80302.1 hypothetical protein B9N43_02895 [Denitratisoma sp. DHT3]